MENREPHNVLISFCSPGGSRTLTRLYTPQILSLLRSSVSPLGQNNLKFNYLLIFINSYKHLMKPKIVKINAVIILNKKSLDIKKDNIPVDKN